MLVAFRCFELCSVDVCYSMSVLGEYSVTSHCPQAHGTQ
jgi:hypothetical protein